MQTRDLARAPGKMLRETNPFSVEIALVSSLELDFDLDRNFITNSQSYGLGVGLFETFVAVDTSECASSLDPYARLACWGNVEGLKERLAVDVNLNVENKREWAVAAITNGDRQVIDFLFHLGVNIGTDHIIDAFERNRVEIVSWALRKMRKGRWKDNIGRQDPKSGRTLLSAITSSQTITGTQLGIARDLIKLGANPGIEDWNGHSTYDHLRDRRGFEAGTLVTDLCRKYSREAKARGLPCHRVYF